jgi:hypothetical protein
MFGFCSARILLFHASLGNGPNGLDVNRVWTEEQPVTKKQQRQDEQQQQDAAQKNPDEWVTGGESMTGPQASYLRTLAQEAGEPIDESLSKAEASKKIDELQEKTGRGRDH